MLCLVHLASYHFEAAAGESHPGVATIAKEMGYAHRTRVSELVTSLEQKGMLKVTRRPGFTSIYNARPFAQAALRLSLDSSTEKRNTSSTEKRTGVVRENVHEEEEVRKPKQEEKIPAAPQRESLPEPNNQPVDTYLPDAQTQWDILIGKDNRRKRSWSIPAAAGGADSLGDALLDIFCEGISIPTDSLPEKKSRQWAAELRKVPPHWAATHDQAVAALRALFDPGSEYAWKSYSTPYLTGFQDDWGVFLARSVQGEPLIKSKPEEKRYYGPRGDFPD